MTKKPEHLTALYGEVLVCKGHPRILFRGKLDSLQAQVVLIQCDALILGVDDRLLMDLDEILAFLREMMRSEVLGLPFERDSILGLSFEQIREQSHNPAQFFGVEAMVLPDYRLGRVYALLNCLRTAVRETEVSAATAFGEREDVTRPDILRGLNRLSSVVYVLMCREISGKGKRP